LSNSKKLKADWGQPVPLSAEQIILWLEGHREWMIEVWNNNPHLRKRWEDLNDPKTDSSDRQTKSSE